ncbi:MAG: cation diffusion facilitator family transporter [Acidimicrobiales bacterium]
MSPAAGADRGSGHGHQHGAGLARSGARHRDRLLLAFVIIAGFFVVEAAAGVVSGSLALLSDAGHMLTDVIGLGMALIAIQLASRFASAAPGISRGSRHTFGLYRLEILAAFVNALLLFGVAIWVLVEAVRRLAGGEEPHVESGLMLGVAVAGLVANLIAFWLLREGAGESLNVEAAYLEVLADTLGSVGVILAAILLRVFGWWWADPIIGAAIGLWILPRTWRLGGNAVRILLQSAPDHIDVAELESALRRIDGVVDVHDLHVWTLTSEMEAASAHLVTDPDADREAVLDRARTLLDDRYGIGHGTFQVEAAGARRCDDAMW